MVSSIYWISLAFQVLPICLCLLTPCSTYTYLHLVVVNIFTFLLYASDKQRSQNGGNRVSEQALLVCSLLGGSPGAAAARQLLRHKTIKPSFIWKYYVCVTIANLLVFYRFF